jgi:outer membrane protein assembly factor BamA
MIKHYGAVSVALLLLCSLPSPAQKKVPPQAIRFQGVPEYTQEELLAAAGLKPGPRLNSAQVKAHARQLNDTGLFKEVKFTSDSKGLLFTLTPASQLFPMRLENVPLTPGKEMDAKLHERFPLYRNLLPAGGSMVDGICRTFEEILAAKGAKVRVQAALTTGLGPHNLTAVNFTVVLPAVHIGRIQLVGISPAVQAKTSALASAETGNSFNTEGTPIDLKRVFEDLYQDQDYAAVQVDVAQADALIVSDQSVDVPYSITVKEGGVYKLGTIDYPAGALVARADVQKILSKEPPGSGRPLDLFIFAVRDAYSAKGYLDCSVAKQPRFDEAAHIVNYSLEIAPGPQYRFASVKFDGAPDAMAARLKLAWKMAPGDIFDASYLSNFAALAQKKDKTLAKGMQTILVTSEFKADPATHEVNCIFHFAKAAQGPD